MDFRFVNVSFIFLLEISEFLSEESSQFFWSYLDEFLNLKVPLYELENDFERYKTSLKLASNFLTAGQTKLLKLSLSLASITPRIQSNLQVQKYDFQIFVYRSD